MRINAGWNCVCNKEKMSWSRNMIADLYDGVLAQAAAVLSRSLGATDFDRAMMEAAERS